MTPADLRTLIEAATPGPWKQSGKAIHNQAEDTYMPTALRGGSIANFIGGGYGLPAAHQLNKRAVANAALTVAAHNLIPEFLALWEAAEALAAPTANADSPMFLFAALDALNRKAEEL